MWRRYGEVLYAAAALVILLLEAAALGVLVWAFLFRSPTFTPGTFGLGQALIGAVSLTALCLAGITTLTLVFTAMSNRRERRRSEGATAWATVSGRGRLRRRRPPGQAVAP